jgi:hypothetical protein
MNDKPMPVILLDWRPMRKNSLLGFAKIKLGALEISDVTVHTANGRKWAGLPSKPILDRDGTVKRDGDKIVYAKVLSWSDRGASDRFSEGVLLAIEANHPGATDL